MGSAFKSLSLASFDGKRLETAKPTAGFTPNRPDRLLVLVPRELKVCAIDKEVRSRVAVALLEEFVISYKCIININKCMLMCLSLLESPKPIFFVHV